jgi:hypothetical protein
MTNLLRKFLAVSDESEESLSALIFAAMRAKAVGAGLVFLRCARVPGVGGWIGLDKDISQDAIDTARLKAIEHAKLVEARVGIAAEIIVEDDEPVDAIRKLVARDAANPTRATRRHRAPTRSPAAPSPSRRR